MATTMQAVVKANAAPGIELREVPVPIPGPGEVLVRVQAASVCGTDLHIYEWNEWAQGRIHPPLIPGHEFAGVVAAVGRGVTAVKEGDKVSAEMHVACGKCLQCRTGLAHVCQHVRILGVDADGAFASYAILPESNIWKLSPAIPQDYASLLDPLGNAVHTVLAGAIAAKTVAITGCGAIGLFSIAVARACGAAKVFAIEVNAHRRGVAAKMGADLALDPSSGRVEEQVLDATGGTGVDVLLEMSGHPAAIELGFSLLRTGGRASLLGIPSRPVELDLARDIIFKGATVQGINGRKMFETWFQMEALLAANKLDLEPVITHRLKLSQFADAMKLLQSGDAIKVVLTPE
ncbi:MAG TPA: L-threonine 3-dehydrogenase [Terracidiphilus sp.]|jgi:threonine 3-dehydrogenase|nr:L-threonine 3-dehydrogenase [Terracidiphilus sp.]